MKSKIISHPAVVISIVSVLALIVGIFSYVILTESPKYTPIKVEKHDLLESVMTNGTVQAANDVDLSFEISGKVSQVFVSVGDKVYTGEPLVKLSQDDALVNLSLAQAALSSAEAQYELNGTQSQNAYTDLLEAQKSLSDQINTSYAVADDAIRNNIDSLFSNPTGISPKINVVMNNSQLETNIESNRTAIEGILNTWNNSTSSIGADTALGYLNQINSFLNDVATAVNNIEVSQSTPETRSMVSMARNNINMAITNLTAANDNLASKQSTYNVSVEQVSGTSASSTSIAGALVEQAQANLDKAKVALSKTVLVAPFDGTVTRMDAKVGLTVSPGASLASLISNSNYQIESYVSEIDVAKLKVGQEATTTLDAYGLDVYFPTKIISVDPAETLQNGVPSYKVVLEFENSDNRIKTGMTANSDIIVSSKNGVLAVPENSLIKRDDKEYVLLYSGNKSPEMHEVETGIIGNDGYTEITSGLSEGDSIANF